MQIIIYDDQLNALKAGMPKQYQAMFEDPNGINVVAAAGFKRVLVKVNDADVDVFRQTKGTLFGILMQGNATSPFQNYTVEINGERSVLPDLESFLNALNSI